MSERATDTGALAKLSGRCPVCGTPETPLIAKVIGAALVVATAALIGAALLWLVVFLVRSALG